MKKIPTIFERDWKGNHQVIDKLVVDPNLLEKATPTRKFDGTAVLVKEGWLYKRYDCKKGRTEPRGFIPADVKDEKTGHWPGWVPVTDGPEDKWYHEPSIPAIDGTYELCGPKVNGNPEGFQQHEFVRHGCEIVHYEGPIAFDGLKQFLSIAGIEGLVWWLEGRMIGKIKRRDFGLSWPIKGGDLDEGEFSRD